MSQNKNNTESVSQNKNNTEEGLRSDRLEEIQKLAEEGNVTNKEMVEILAGTILSVSRNNREIKDLLRRLIDVQEQMSEKLDVIIQHTASPIYRLCDMEEPEELEDEEAE